MTLKQAEVIMAVAANGLSVSRAAKSVYMHRNTIVFHVENVKKTTGKDPLDFYDMQELLQEAKKVLNLEEKRAMRIRIELGKADIVDIIAEKHGVKPEDVTITTTERCEGYGPGEHIVHEPVAYVYQKIEK